MPLRDSVRPVQAHQIHPPQPNTQADYALYDSLRVSEGLGHRNIYMHRSGSVALWPPMALLPLAIVDQTVDQFTPVAGTKMRQ